MEIGQRRKKFLAMREMVNLLINVGERDQLLNARCSALTFKMGDSARS
jgi:hypothetical protein